MHQSKQVSAAEWVERIIDLTTHKSALCNWVGTSRVHGCDGQLCTERHEADLPHHRGGLTRAVVSAILKVHGPEG